MKHEFCNVIKIFMVKKGSQENFWQNILLKLERISAAQKIFLVDNLRVMLKAGLSIVEALRILTLQIPNRRLKQIIEKIKEEVEKGQPLAEALKSFPELLPPIYARMIAAGEISGKLDESLLEIVKQMKKNHEMTSKIRGAMIYPAVVLLAVAGVGVEMIIFVLPKLLTLFEELSVPLPLATRFLIAVSKFLINYGLGVIILIVLLISLFIYLKKKPAVEWRLHGWLLALPLLGKVSQKINLARFTLTLSSLLKSAIPILEALEITADVLSNVRFKTAVREAARQIKTGKPIADSLAEFPKLFPPLATQMIMVGEKSGTTEELLNEVANYYNEEVDQVLKNFSTIIEPILIIFLGVVVGGLAIAVIMPMYSLSQGI